MSNDVATSPASIPTDISQAESGHAQSAEYYRRHATIRQPEYCIHDYSNDCEFTIDVDGRSLFKVDVPPPAAGAEAPTGPYSHNQPLYDALYANATVYACIPVTDATTGEKLEQACITTSEQCSANGINCYFGPQCFLDLRNDGRQRTENVVELDGSIVERTFTYTRVTPGHPAVPNATLSGIVVPELDSLVATGRPAQTLSYPSFGVYTAISRSPYASYDQCPGRYFPNRWRECCGRDRMENTTPGGNPDPTAVYATHGDSLAATEAGHAPGGRPGYCSLNFAECDQNFEPFSNTNAGHQAPLYCMFDFEQCASASQNCGTDLRSLDDTTNVHCWCEAARCGQDFPFSTVAGAPACCATLRQA